MLAVVLAVTSSFVPSANIGQPVLPPAVRHHIVNEGSRLVEGSSDPIGLFPTSSFSTTALLAERERPPPKVLTEDELVARDNARKIGAVVLFLGAAPSFFAQNELVWKKGKKQKK
jgi:hypothetical protein